MCMGGGGRHVLVLALCLCASVACRSPAGAEARTGFGVDLDRTATLKAWQSPEATGVSIGLWGKGSAPWSGAVVESECIIAIDYRRSQAAKISSQPVAAGAVGTVVRPHDSSRSGPSHVRRQVGAIPARHAAGASHSSAVG